MKSTSTFSLIEKFASWHANMVLKPENIQQPRHAHCLILQLRASMGASCSLCRLHNLLYLLYRLAHGAGLRDVPGLFSQFESQYHDLAVQSDHAQRHTIMQWFATMRCSL